MATAREVTEGRQVQGVEERISYVIPTTPWGSSPTGVVVKGYDTTDMSDASSTIFFGSASVSGDNITTPAVVSLTEGRTYRIEVKFVSGGDTFEFYFMIKCER